MSKPGQKPGGKQAPLIEAPAVLSAADRINPAKLTGDDLRHLAYQSGMAKSSMVDMPDAKIREQLRYITQNNYAT